MVEIPSISTLRCATAIATVGTDSARVWWSRCRELTVGCLFHHRGTETRRKAIAGLAEEPCCQSPVSGWLLRFSGAERAARRIGACVVETGLLLAVAGHRIGSRGSGEVERTQRARC